MWVKQGILNTFWSILLFFSVAVLLSFVRPKSGKRTSWHIGMCLKASVAFHRIKQEQSLCINGLCQQSIYNINLSIILRKKKKQNNTDFF